MSTKIYELKAEQGWTDYTFLTLALDFIEEAEMNEKFIEYLRYRADEENTPAEYGGYWGKNWETNASYKIGYASLGDRGALIRLGEMLAADPDLEIHTVWLEDDDGETIRIIYSAGDEDA